MQSSKVQTAYPCPELSPLHSAESIFRSSSRRALLNRTATGTQAWSSDPILTWPELKSFSTTSHDPGCAAHQRGVRPLSSLELISTRPVLRSIETVNNDLGDPAAQERGVRPLLSLELTSARPVLRSISTGFSEDAVVQEYGTHFPLVNSPSR